MRIYAPLSRIRDNRFQRRSVYANIEQLAHSAQSRLHTHRPTLGLLQSPRGRLVDEEGRPVPFGQFTAEQLQAADFLARSELFVELSIGHRRKRAFDWLAENGDAAYQAAVLPLDLADLDDTGQLDDVFEENYRRGDLAAADLGELIVLKKAQMGPRATDADVAAAWGIGRSTVTNLRQLLERLPSQVLDANRDGRLSGAMAQALIKVADLEKATRGRVKWGKGDRPGHTHYDLPINPTAFMQWAIDCPEEASTAAVASYLKQAIDHHGREIPDTVATFAVEADGVVQAKCKGCPLRFDGRCTDRGCLDAKRAAYGRKLAEDYAWERQWLYSEDPADFVANSHSEGETLFGIYQAGGCRHLVIGWQAEGAAWRPQGYQYANGSRAFEPGSLAGLKLGHRGAVNGCAPQAARARPGPPLEVVEAWGRKGRSRVQRLEREGRQVLAGRLAALGAEALRPLMALVAPVAVNGDAGKMAKAVLDHIWDTGKGRPRTASPLRGYNMLAEVMLAAGVDVTTLPGAADEQGALAEAAERALCFYYDEAKRYSSRQDIETAQAALTAVDADFRVKGKEWGGLPRELVEIWSAVGDALAEIGAKKDGE